MGVRFLLVTAFVSTLALSTRAAAQSSPWTPEVSAGGGLGHVFRWEDQTFGNRVTAGAAIGIAHASGWVIEIHGDKTFGLEPPVAPCGLVNVECVGIAHDGPTSIATMTFGTRFHLGSGRVQPYVLAGLGVMWSESLHSLTQVRGPIAIVSEHASTDHGFGPDLGGGIRAVLTPRWSVSGEVRWLDASWQSRENLAVTRVMIGVSGRLR